MTQYKSLYEEYIAELREKGKIRVLSPEVNMQIMEELSEGMEEVVNDHKVKERQSELELAGIYLR